jgi:hypothetical protein
VRNAAAGAVTPIAQASIDARIDRLQNPATATQLAVQGFDIMGMQRPLALGLLVLGTCGLPVAVSGADLVNAVPPAANRAPAVARAVTALRLYADAPALQLDLPEPTAADFAAMQRQAPGLAKPVPIGFGRQVPAGQRRIALSTLAWQATADGGRAAHIQVTSPGAVGLRVALATSADNSDVVLRMVGSGSPALVKGPFTLAQVAQDSARFGNWWSPVLAGSTATLEIAVPKGEDVDALELTIPLVSHLTQPRMGPVTKTVNPGGSGACEINWRCEPQTPALVNAAKAIGLMTYTADNGGTYNCTGTLLNDAGSSNTPYFFTAHHCISSAGAAATLNVVWFYDANDCSHPTDTGTYAETDGALLLAGSQAEDWVLLQLKEAPPAGTLFSAWNATPITSGAVIDLHHPRADVKKFSAGNLVPGPAGGYVQYTENDDDGMVVVDAPLAQVIWTLGVTEGGSSGSGLLTLNQGGYYEVRGGLYGGGSSCSTPKDPDFFSRMDRMLPLTRQYLTPGVPTQGRITVVEYYNQSLDHYFMTGSASDISALDNGVISGWVRTGLRFLAYSSQVAGTNPVCRFYRLPGYGDSHFFSANPADCQAVLDRPDLFPGWALESPAAFYIAVPDATGNCAAGTHPIWRFFHAAVTNHRYTPDLAIRTNLDKTEGWYPEGYAPNDIAMCSPDGS